MNMLQSMKNIDRAVLCKLIGQDIAGAFALSEKILSSAGYSILKGGSPEDHNHYLIAIPLTVPYHQIALVAHVDTCDEDGPSAGEREIVETDGFLENNKPFILGADDRAGVYAILKIVEGCSGPRPVIILTDGEEMGSIGVKYLIQSDVLGSYIDNITMFIQLDRRDYITYNKGTRMYSLPKKRNYVCYCGEPPRQMTDMLYESNYVKKKGSSSDVRHLTDAYGKPHVNISIGYCNEHTPYEALSLQLLNDTIDDVSRFLAEWTA